jgi:hypothetical protein
MQLERQLKIALDESRLLILGAQVLFGFQFNGIFQEQRTLGKSEITVFKHRHQRVRVQRRVGRLPLLALEDID